MEQPKPLVMKLGDLFELGGVTYRYIAFGHYEPVESLTKVFDMNDAGPIRGGYEPPASGV